MKIKELLEQEGHSVLSKFGHREEHVDFTLAFHHAGLTSLEGSPKSTTKIYTCAQNRLESLEGGPEKVGMDFFCSGNKLTSLEGGPTEVGRGYDASGNNLITLKGAPKKIVADFAVVKNSLTSLEFAPAEIGKNFYCQENQLTSLEGIHKHIKFIGGCAFFTDNPIKSHMLGLLRIKGLQGVEFENREDVQNIINKHLGGDRDIFACQEELIAAGYEEYAKL